MRKSNRVEDWVKIVPKLTIRDILNLPVGKRVKIYFMDRNMSLDENNVNKKGFNC